MARRAFFRARRSANGQPSAIAVDIIALMDALKIEKAILAGCDWGARTADIMAALWPERCKALVSVSGYLIGSQEAGKMPLPPKAELEWWYQYLLRHRTRPGRLREIPARFCQAHLAARFAEMGLRRRDVRSQRGAAFDNPDHVDIVIHNYRWRLGLAEGEPKFDDLEKRLAASPVITVPTITLEGDANGAPHPDPVPTPRNSPANMRTGLSRAASGTTCRRKRRRLSPRRSSTSTAMEPNRC